MHIKLSIRGRTRYRWTQRREKVQNESNNTAMPLLEDHSRLYSSKVPRSVVCSETVEEPQSPLSPEQILAPTISNHFTPDEEWILSKKSLFSSEFSDLNISSCATAKKFFFIIIIIIYCIG